jgi:hypothetical protein
MMKLLARALLAVSLAAVAAPMASSPASAQAMAGRQLPDRPVVGVDYYKAPPGKQDEWLALYLKWHRPIMEYQIQQGATLSSTVYANSSHSIEPSWDFMIINISPPPSQAKKLPLTRGEVIKKLFPDLDAYAAGEASRWAMTVGHWDQSVIEVDLKAAHPGVYYPIIPAGK